MIDASLVEPPKWDEIYGTGGTAPEINEANNHTSPTTPSTQSTTVRTKQTAMKNFAIGALHGCADFAVSYGVDALISKYLSAAPIPELPREDLPASLRRAEEDNSFFVGSIAGPIVEEFLFRKLAPNILSRIIRKGAQIACAGSLARQDSQAAKALKIGLSALAFGLIHLSNGPGSGKTAFFSTLSGIHWGLLKESRGMAGTIGAHMANNAICWALTKHQIDRMKKDLS